MKPHYATISTGMCKHCIHCNVQTGMAGLNSVFFCEREGYAEAVDSEGGCQHFEREVGSDDDA